MYLVIIVVIAALISGWWIRAVNNFKRKKIKIDESFSGIEVSLTKRFDQLTKLLEVTRGYIEHEKEVFTQVISMRRGMSIVELSETCTKMDALSTRINAVAESYPELRSAEIFSELQTGIRDAEKHLQAARRLYNSNVTAYNTAIAVFPSSIVAGILRLQNAEFFTAEEAKKVDVHIKF